MDTGNTVDETVKVKKGFKDVGDQVKETSQKTGEGTQRFSKLKDTLSEVHPGLDGVTSGIGKVGAAFKALLANPIILFLAAIVATLGLLYTAFSNSFEGGKKLEQVFAGIKAAGQSLIDNIDKIFSAAKNLLTLNFKGFSQDIKDIGNSASAAYSAMAKLTKQAQDLHKEELQNALDGAEREKRLAILREQAQDDEIPKEKRKAALLELKKDAEQNAKDDIELAKKVTENKIAQLTLQKDGEKKNQDEINKLKIEQIRVETDNANELRRIGKQLSTFEKQDAAEARERAKAAADARKKANDEHIAEEKKLSEELEAIRKKRAQLIADSSLITAKNIRDEEKRILDERIKANEAAEKKIIDAQLTVMAQRAGALMQEAAERQRATDASIALAQAEATARVDASYAIANASGALSEAIGRETAFGKGLASAQALINTYLGITEVIKQKSTLPSPFDVIAKVANVATIAATGFSAVKNIMKVQVPGGGGAAGGSIQAPLAPTPVQTSTRIASSSVQAIGAAIPASRSYVLDTDNLNAAERAARINRAARIGG